MFFDKERSVSYVLKTHHELAGELGSLIFSVRLLSSFTSCRDC